MENKCENCVHSDVCLYKPCLAECPLFKDKSLFVELPCEVGDYVYRIVGENTTKPWVWHWEIVEIMIYQDEIVYRDGSDNIIENKDFGKTVFLTKESAEAKLREMEADNV